MKLNPKAKEAFDRFVAALAEGTDTTDLSDAFHDFIKGSPAIREAAAGVAANIAETLEGVKAGTVTKEQFLFVLEMSKKSVVILGEAMKVKLFRTAQTLFVDRLLAFFLRIGLTA